SEGQSGGSRCIGRTGVACCACASWRCSDAGRNLRAGGAGRRRREGPPRPRPRPGTQGASPWRSEAWTPGSPWSRPSRPGSAQGLVVQNPALMGELAVRTLVEHLEKKPVKPVIDTGSAMVTPENMGEPKLASLLDPPKEENVSASSLTGTRTKKWRVFVIPKG